MFTFPHLATYWHDAKPEENPESALLPMHWWSPFFLHSYSRPARVIHALSTKEEAEVQTHEAASPNSESRTRTLIHTNSKACLAVSLGEQRRARLPHSLEATALACTLPRSSLGDCSMPQYGQEGKMYSKVTPEGRRWYLGQRLHTCPSGRQNGFSR